MIEYEEICIDEEQVCVLKAGDKAMTVKPNLLHLHLFGEIATIERVYFDEDGREWVSFYFYTGGKKFCWPRWRLEKVGD